MDRKQIVLAALAPARGAQHSPVQIQKLLFLIDRILPKLVGGPYFDFQPYHYGPFDREVYRVLDELNQEGLCDVALEWSHRLYRLTVLGQELGEKALERLPEKARESMQKLSGWVLSLTFTELVSAIYKAYPEMRAHSVFEE
jgi:hypothetical protein